ncbi:exosome complex component RRP46-like isoform X2 [Rhopilema esculentum]|uniref:exosome complex component RRP46-like isoform X2 n=1 Tax=Rhopilema esculentum TaxID=499914 RepID=UPI0031E1398B
MAEMEIESGGGGEKQSIIAAGIKCECTQSILTRADGSASFKQGASEALAAVYGPVEVKMNKEIIDKATVECNYRVKSGLPGNAEKVVERLIRNSCDSVILSSYSPRSAISIIVQVVNDGGLLLSCALNAAFMALVNADIPLKCMAAAVTCFISKNGKIYFNNSQDDDQYFGCLAASKEAVKSIFSFQRKALERGMSLEKKT